MLIKGTSLLHDGQLLRDQDIQIRGNRITAIGERLKEEDCGKVIDARGKLAVPGLVNGHTHLAMTLIRGYADDMDLMPWLQDKIWPLESLMIPEDIRWGVKLGCLELIRSGVTCYNDMYYFAQESALATREMGLRAVLSGVLFDMRPELIRDVEPFLRRWRGDDLIIPALGPHAVYSCSQETLCQARELAERYRAPLHIHLSETKSEVESFHTSRGMSPVEYLDQLGLLSKHTLAAHCVWLSEKDHLILARSGTSVAHCPISNLKLASGVAPVDALHRVGVNICLGTDGACSNNSLNLFQEMKAAALVQKCHLSRPTALPAPQVWSMATNNGYRALGLDLGLRAGALADLALIDLKCPWLFPQSNLLSHLVYSMSGGVDTTVVNGRVLMQNGVIPGEQEILEKAQRQYLNLLDRHQ